jgi:hypothetical protein
MRSAAAISGSGHLTLRRPFLPEVGCHNDECRPKQETNCCEYRYDGGSAHEVSEEVADLAAPSSLRTAAAELPTLSIARVNSSLVTPKCRVQYLM